MGLRNRNGVAVLLRAALLAACWFGVRDAVLSEDGFLASESLLYFTYQSNLWVLAVTLVYFVLGVIRLFSSGVRPPRALQIARYAVTVAITITFLVFWLLLSPRFRQGDLLSLNNQLLHTVVPVLFVTDFLLFDRGDPMGRPSALWAAAPPMFYLIFSLVHAAAYPAFFFRDGSRYPYFFLDADKYGWFGFKAGLGVFWWALLLACLTLSIGYGYRFIQLKTIRKQ